MSVVNITTPVIIKAWQIPIGIGSLIILSYLLTVTSLIMIMGKLGDRYGFRNLILAGFGIFALGSALCGCSPDIITLIGSRIVQAIGAAMFSSVGAAIIAQYLPSSVRGRSLGYLIAFSALGYALGPGLGSIITSIFGWRWIFLFNIPLAVAGIILGYFCIPRDAHANPENGQDVAGSAAFILAILGILSAFSLFQVAGTPDYILIGLFGAGIFFGLIFLYHERTSRNPLFGKSLFRHRDFNFGLITCFIVSALFSGVTYLMPLYLINSRHLDQLLAGIIMMTPAIISIIAAPCSGYFADRYGSPIVSAIAIGLSAIGFLIFFTFNPLTAVIIIIIGMIVTRVSTAAFFGPNAKLIMGYCPTKYLGSGSALLMTVRHIGLVVGIALFQSIFALRMYAAGIPRDGTPLVPRLTPQLSVLGYQAVYLTSFALCLLVIILILQTKDATKIGETE